MKKDQDSLVKAFHNDDDAMEKVRTSLKMQMLIKTDKITSKCDPYFFDLIPKEKLDPLHEDIREIYQVKKPGLLILRKKIKIPRSWTRKLKKSKIRLKN